ncbi:MAG: PilN domain-containing protein [Microcoleaceae cyanobacterium]
MYSLDINFLNDRPDYKPVERTFTSSRKPGAPIDRKPILIGVLAALALNAAWAGSWLIFNGRNNQLQKELDALQAQLDERNSEVQALDQIYAEAKRANEEADALAGVFNEIKPWSALTQEIAELIQVAGVKVTQIEQTEPQASSSSASSSEETAAAPARNTSNLEIQGIASSLAELNDFILLLSQSAFFDPEKTKLVTANLEDNPTKLEESTAENNSRAKAPELQPVIEYTIKTSLSSANASELLPELKSNGATGLVNRIETLQRKGVIQ